MNKVKLGSDPWVNLYFSSMPMGTDSIQCCSPPSFRSPRQKTRNKSHGYFYLEDLNKQVLQTSHKNCSLNSVKTAHFSPESTMFVPNH